MADRCTVDAVVEGSSPFIHPVKKTALENFQGCFFINLLPKTYLHPGVNP